MRIVGLEPTRRGHRNLNPTRLPIPSYPHILFYICRDRLQQYRNPIRLPVAVPEISSSLFAHEISTAATRSARFIRHRRRSHRFPIPPHPHIAVDSISLPTATCQFIICFAQSAISCSLSLHLWPRTDKPGRITAPLQLSARSFSEFAIPLPSLVQRGTIFFPLKS